MLHGLSTEVKVPTPNPACYTVAKIHVSLDTGYQLGGYMGIWVAIWVYARWLVHIIRWMRADQCMHAGLWDGLIGEMKN